MSCKFVAGTAISQAVAMRMDLVVALLALSHPACCARFLQRQRAPPAPPGIGYGSGGYKIPEGPPPSPEGQRSNGRFSFLRRGQKQPPPQQQAPPQPSQPPPPPQRSGGTGQRGADDVGYGPKGYKIPAGSPPQPDGSVLQQLQSLWASAADGATNAAQGVLRRVARTEGLQPFVMVFMVGMPGAGKSSVIDRR